MNDKNRQLRENFARDWNNNKLPLTEIKHPKKIIEAEGKEYSVIKGYEVPIWRLNERNLNNRVYSSKLAEKTIKENKKTFVLKDHPDGDGSVDNIVAVAENPHVKENIMWANCYFVDEEFEKKVERILEREFGLGVSSSCYGDLDDDGNVLEEGFEVERYFDFVLEPSYQVYLTKESAIHEEKEKDIIKILKDEGFDDKQILDALEDGEVLKKYNISKKDAEEAHDKLKKKIKKESIKEITTNINVDDKKSQKEKEPMAEKTEKKVLSLEEKNLRLGVKNLFEKVDQESDLQAKISIYNDIIDYCDGVEFADSYIEEAENKKKEIQNTLFELAKKSEKVDDLEKDRTSFEEKIKEMEESKSSIQKDLEDIQEKYNKATELLEGAREREESLKEMYEVAVAEKNGMITASEYKEALAYIENLEEQMKKLKEKMRKYRSLVNEEEKKDDDKDDSEDDDEDEKEDKEDKDEKEDKKEKKKESVLSFQEDDVIDYYNDLVKRNPNVEKIKEKLISCKTVLEAQKQYLNLRDLVEDNPTPSTLHNRTFSKDPEKSNKKISITEALSKRPNWK